MSIDLGGAEGGRMAAAFAAGVMFAVGVCRWIWAILRKAKDDQIAMLAKRVEHLEADRADDRRRCDEQNAALQHRVIGLEALLTGMDRQQTQLAISEIRMEKGKDGGQ